MAQVNLIEAGVLGDVPEPSIRLSWVGVVGTPTSPLSARVQVTEVSVNGAPWTPEPPRIQLFGATVLGAPYTPPTPGDDGQVGIFILTPSGWRPVVDRI